MTIKELETKIQKILQNNSIRIIDYCNNKINFIFKGKVIMSYIDGGFDEAQHFSFFLVQDKEELEEIKEILGIYILYQNVDIQKQVIELIKEYMELK